VNLVAPAAVRGAELARKMGGALRRPSWLPVPVFAIKLAAGGIAQYLAHGRQVTPAKLQSAGFEFTHPDLAGALDDLVGRKSP
jgi:NAD dependent epimerase/dehydratase family enzyme